MTIWLKFLLILVEIKPVLVCVNGEGREIIVIWELFLAYSKLIRGPMLPNTVWSFFCLCESE